jgi:hypothetical protein
MKESRDLQVIRKQWTKSKQKHYSFAAANIYQPGPYLKLQNPSLPVLVNQKGDPNMSMFSNIMKL